MYKQSNSALVEVMRWCLICGVRLDVRPGHSPIIYSVVDRLEHAEGSQPRLFQYPVPQQKQRSNINRLLNAGLLLRPQAFPGLSRA